MKIREFQYFANIIVRDDDIRPIDVLERSFYAGDENLHKVVVFHIRETLKDIVSVLRVKITGLRREGDLYIFQGETLTNVCVHGSMGVREGRALIYIPEYIKTELDGMSVGII